jgi:PA domain
MRIQTALVIGAFALVSSISSAATITVVNADSPGEGFNDPTPVAALPSNPNTTLGAQRLLVFQTAALRWGQLLNSSVDIVVNAQFNPLTCSGTSAVLGSAGAATAFADFANAPVPGTLYSAALANSLAGSDLNGATQEINARFNVDLDNGTCLTNNAGWYYSTLASDITPANRTALLPVVFHELAHGLGFQTFTSSSTGAQANGLPSIWDRFLADAPTGTRWFQMTDAQRQASSISDPNLIWTGPLVTAEKGNFLSTSPSFIINSPPSIAGPNAAQAAAFGPAVPQAGVTGNLIAAVDPSDAAGALTTDGCSLFSNAASVAGNIALIDRGNCNFSLKVENAQAAGATAVVIANNAATGLAPMGGTSLVVTIPSYGLSQANGVSIRNALATGTVNATLGYGTTLAGTQVSQGVNYVRMNAPNPVQPGSSVSHFTVDTFPNLLMEPAINPNLFNDVDLTIPLFEDIGWRVSSSSVYFRNGFE